MAVVPDNIAASLGSINPALSTIFSNVENVVESAGSIYDILRGDADNLPAPAPVSAPAPTPAPVQPKTGMSTGIWVFIGLAALMAAGMFWSRR